LLQKKERKRIFKGAHGKKSKKLFCGVKKITRPEVKIHYMEILFCILSVFTREGGKEKLSHLMRLLLQPVNEKLTN
jgi:hypothetical protein